MMPRILYFSVFPLVWIASWMLVAGVSFETRALTVGEEQRILSIAWSMWRDSAFLTPWSDNYSASPTFPMVFWVINLGWALFDVSGWWPRLMGYASGLGCVFLTAALARILWPGWTGLGAMSGTALSALVAWMALAGILGPVVLAAVFVIAAMYALVWTWRTGRRDGFFYFGLSVAACVLTIGPFAWIVCLPAALLAPVWGRTLAEQVDDDRSPPHGWRQWYLGVLGGSALGLALFAGWLGSVLVAELATTGFLLAQYWSPVVTLFSGQRLEDQSWWYPLIIFNCMAVPWVLWSPAWRALAGVVSLVSDGGARLCMIWIASVLAPVSIVAGFNAADLLLALPALALVIAFLVFCRADRETDDSSGARRGESGIGLVLVITGAVTVVAPFSGTVFQVPWWIGHLAGSWGVVLIALGAAVACAMPRMIDLRMMTISAAMTVVVVVGWLVAEPLNRNFFAAGPAAVYVSGQLAEGRAVAFAGPYAGEFNFAARLTEDLPVLALDDKIGIAAWVAGNPGAIVAQIVDEIVAEPASEAQPLEHFAYGTRYMVFWSGDMISVNPALLAVPAP